MKVFRVDARVNNRIIATERWILQREVEICPSDTGLLYSSVSQGSLRTTAISCCMTGGDQTDKVVASDSECR